MRKIKFTIYSLIVLILVSYTVWTAYPAFNSWLTKPAKDRKNPPGTNVALAYQIKEAKWTTFPIASNTRSLKFITNAAYYKTYANTIKYAIMFEILNNHDEIIFIRKYHLKNNTRLYRKRHSSRILSNPFLINGRYYITPNSDFVFPLTDLKNPDKIRIKWVPIKGAKNVAGVCLRLLSQSFASQSKQNILWYRLTPETKESLATGNFFPPNMLTASEKKNIINSMWSPIGPEGNTTDDYSVKRIGRMPEGELKPIHLLRGSPPKTSKKKKHKSELAELYLSTGLDGFFKPQTSKDMATCRRLFSKLFKGATAAELRNSWKTLGMNIKEFKDHGKTFTVVYEEKNKLYGRGFYMFCKSDLTRNVVLEMPHRFWDTHTGNIGYKLMLTGNFAAGAWNTVQRYQTPNDLPTSSDMAHAANSFFYSFTEAFTETMPEKSLLIQLHGFSNKNQLSHYGKKARAVISNSTPAPIPTFLPYARSLKEAMPQPAYIYPLTNIKWLAALENVSAEVLRDADKKQIFIHLEMNKNTRLDMLNSAKLRKQFTKSVIKNTKKLYPATDK